MTEPLDDFDELLLGFSGAFECKTANTNHFMTRVLGSGTGYQNLDLPVGLNIINLESDVWIKGTVTVQIASVDGSVPTYRIAELEKIDGSVWRFSKMIAATVPSQLRMSMIFADPEDVGKKIMALVSPIPPS